VQSLVNLKLCAIPMCGAGDNQASDHCCTNLARITRRNRARKSIATPIRTASPRRSGDGYSCIAAHHAISLEEGNS
jgi:hypothetical protein